jgi:DNA end-binding protein Ku
MLATTLRYDYEVRDEKSYFKNIGSPHADKEMVDLAIHILDGKAGHFDAGKFKDEYETALRKLVKRKASGKTIERKEAPERAGNVVDLMEALRRSLGSKGKAKPAYKAKAKRQSKQRTKKAS